MPPKKGDPFNFDDIYIAAGAEGFVKKPLSELKKGPAPGATSSGSSNASHAKLPDAQPKPLPKPVPSAPKPASTVVMPAGALDFLDGLGSSTAPAPKKPAPAAASNDFFHSMGSPASAPAKKPASAAASHDMFHSLGSPAGALVPPTTSSANHDPFSMFEDVPGAQPVVVAPPAAPAAPAADGFAGFEDLPAFPAQPTSSASVGFPPAQPAAAAAAAAPAAAHTSAAGDAHLWAEFDSAPQAPAAPSPPGRAAAAPKTSDQYPTISPSAEYTSLAAHSQPQTRAAVPAHVPHASASMTTPGYGRTQTNPKLESDSRNATSSYNRTPPNPQLETVSREASSGYGRMQSNPQLDPGSSGPAGTHDRPLASRFSESGADGAGDQGKAGSGGGGMVGMLRGFGKRAVRAAQVGLQHLETALERMDQGPLSQQPKGDAVPGQGQGGEGSGRGPRNHPHAHHATTDDDPASVALTLLAIPEDERAGILATLPRPMRQQVEHMLAQLHAGETLDSGDSTLGRVPSALDVDIRTSAVDLDAWDESPPPRGSGSGALHPSVSGYTHAAPGSGQHLSSSQTHPAQPTVNPLHQAPPVYSPPQVTRLDSTQPAPARQAPPATAPPPPPAPQQQQPAPTPITSPPAAPAPPSPPPEEDHDFLGISDGPARPTPPAAAAPAPAPAPARPQPTAVPAAAAPSFDAAPAPRPQPPAPTPAPEPIVADVDDMHDFFSGGGPAAPAPSASASSSGVSRTAAPARSAAPAPRAAAPAAPMMDLSWDSAGVDTGAHGHLYESNEGVEGEPELRKQLRAARLAEKHAKMQAALAGKLAADVEEARQRDEQVELKEQHKGLVDTWMKKSKGNIRGLLGSLQTVLWEDSGWVPIGMGDLLEPGQIRKGWMKANLLVHPDKVRQRNGSAEQVARADMIFDVLKDAWNTFLASNK